MNRTNLLWTAFVLGLFFKASAAGQEFEVNWFTVDGGGGMESTGGAFRLSGTIGQPDAGVMSGGTFTLTGGFWAGASVVGGPCIGDANGDGAIDLADLATVLTFFGTQSGATFSQGDFDGDGDVDLGDLANLLIVFGSQCP